MSTFRMLIGPDEGADVRQLVVRAALLLAFGIVCIRVTGRRTFGYTPLDIIVALIVGSNISRVMTGKAAVWPALAATFTLVVLHRLLAYATIRCSFLTPLIKAKPVIREESKRVSPPSVRFYVPNRLSA